MYEAVSVCLKPYYNHAQHKNERILLLIFMKDMQWLPRTKINPVYCPSPAFKNSSTHKTSTPLINTSIDSHNSCKAQTPSWAHRRSAFVSACSSSSCSCTCRT
mmetsp:Transcript_28044/g.67571  ORF Transcript_28044/g.67571 Transcript_28044/m.67571 type:complete len:103 (+) Transcript_28044:309-617(+)